MFVITRVGVNLYFVQYLFLLCTITTVTTLTPNIECCKQVQNYFSVHQYDIIYIAVLTLFLMYEIGFGVRCECLGYDQRVLNSYNFDTISPLRGKRFPETFQSPCGV